jgi:phage terminase large subunit
MGEGRKLDVIAPDGTLKIRTAPVFYPLLKPARYKAAWGGRGCGKSHFFAELIVEESARPGTRIVCIREVQRTLQESAKRLIEKKLVKFGLGELDGYKVFRDRIETPKGGVISFMGMQDHTAESIKSLEGYSRAWVEEAQTLSQKSLDLLRPTIREPGSQIWFSWNPIRRSDPVDMFFRGAASEGLAPLGATIVKASWRDNPWWNKTLEQERVNCLQHQPDQYGHIWEGEYARILSGAYYATALTAMRASGRLGRVAADPLMSCKAFWDIGGTGAKADHTVIWIAQFVGREIRVLDYYEARGQPLGAHINWLRSNGYANALMVLPHDGAAHDKVFAVSFESALTAAGFETQVVPNQGRAAASNRIEAARRLFPRIWINEETCSAGVDALGAYHAKRDDERMIDLGPEHDWASHSSDAFGMMCVFYEEPLAPKYKRRKSHDQRSWMSM